MGNNISEGDANMIMTNINFCQSMRH